MARYLVERNYVEVLGHIWQPGIGPCAQQITLRDYDVGNIETPLTRESVLDWVYLNTGDFQEILDFSASIGDTEIPWADEENEMTYLDCMFPEDRDD